MANARRTKKERASNPLDEPSAKYGKNPRALSAAVRRSQESTGMSSTGARGIARKSARISKHDSTKQREKQEDATSRVRDAHASSPEIARNKLRSRNHAPAASGRKGGPGKRRPYPKKAGGGR